MTKHGPILERRPEFIPIADYQQAGAEIDGLLGSLPGIAAVYRIGSVSAPGISDVDRIAVVEESRRYPTVWGRLSERTRHIAMHSPFLVDAGTFVQHRWFAFLDPLELVSGTALELGDPPASNLLEAITGIEGLVISRLKLAKQLSIGRIKVRPFLCELHNVRHDLRLAGISAAAAPLASALTAEVLEVRSNWWEIADHEQDRRVVELASSAGTAIDEALAGFSNVASETATIVSMSLNAEWKNVVLTNGAVVSGTSPSFRLASLSGRVSRRAAEFAWRHERVQLALPAPVISLLAAAAAGDSELLAERLAVVRRYRAFMKAQGPGWAGIGLAKIFTRA